MVCLDTLPDSVWLTEIKWSVDSSNNLIFKNLNGSKLVVNRGNSFIGYYKASASQDVNFQ